MTITLVRKEEEVNQSEAAAENKLHTNKPSKRKEAAKTGEKLI
jgi:hypothetical protein